MQTSIEMNNFDIKDIQNVYAKNVTANSVLGGVIQTTAGANLDTLNTASATNAAAIAVNENRLDATELATKGNKDQLTTQATTLDAHNTTLNTHSTELTAQKSLINGNAVVGKDNSKAIELLKLKDIDISKRVETVNANLLDSVNVVRASAYDNAVEAAKLKTVVAGNTGNIASNTAGMTTNKNNILTNTNKTNANATAIALHENRLDATELATKANTDLLATHSATLSTHTATLSAHSKELGVQKALISSNTAQGKANSSSIDLLKQKDIELSKIIATNHANALDAISVVRADTYANAVKIASLQTAVNGNTAKINANIAKIAQNKTDIDVNKIDIAANKTDISTNKKDISTNLTRINVSEINIGNNASKISTNEKDIESARQYTDKVYAKANDTQTEVNKHSLRIAVLEKKAAEPAGPTSATVTVGSSGAFYKPAGNWSMYEFTSTVNGQEASEQVSTGTMACAVSDRTKFPLLKTGAMVEKYLTCEWHCHAPNNTGGCQAGYKEFNGSVAAYARYSTRGQSSFWVKDGAGKRVTFRQ
ncbi:hypothetical protein [Psychromonas antarctica]|uniref:hypothetical protein n=1 Tax=Psychromonas antarctica TaxID=67573 RepID=UPI001EE949EF|nr:hypothetical protein [Psychromonas antarctica]MCG6201062.1 hypothetical protein [Psychromonas antarctica]